MFCTVCCIFPNIADKTGNFLIGTKLRHDPINRSTRVDYTACVKESKESEGVKNQNSGKMKETTGTRHVKDHAAAPKAGPSSAVTAAASDNPKEDLDTISGEEDVTIIENFE